MQKIYTAVRVVTMENGGLGIHVFGSSTKRSIINQMIWNKYLDELAKVENVYHSEHLLDTNDCLNVVVETDSHIYEGEHIFINYKTVINESEGQSDIITLSKEPITTPKNLKLNSSIIELASSFDKHNATRIYNVLYHRMGYTDVLDVLIAIKKGQIKQNTKLNHIGPLFVNALIKIVNEVYYRVSEAEYEQQCKERLESRKHY